MQYFNGKPIEDGTGRELYSRLYSVAILDSHFNKQYWRVLRQTNDAAAAIVAYNTERYVLGNSAVLSIVKPGEIVELHVVKGGEQDGRDCYSD